MCGFSYDWTLFCLLSTAGCDMWQGPYHTFSIYLYKSFNQVQVTITRCWLYFLWLPKVEFHYKSKDIFDITKRSEVVKERSDEDERLSPKDPNMYNRASLDFSVIVILVILLSYQQVSLLLIQICPEYFKIK